MQARNAWAWLEALSGLQGSASTAGAEIRTFLQCAGLQLRHQEKPIDRRGRCDPVLLVVSVFATESNPELDSYTASAACGHRLRS